MKICSCSVLFAVLLVGCKAPIDEQIAAKDVHVGQQFKESRDKANNLLNQGIEAMNASDLAQAEKLFEQALDVKPNYGLARYHLAEVLDKQGKADLAYKTLRDLYEPKDGSIFGSADQRLLLRYAEMSLERGETLAADRALKRITDRQYTAPTEEDPEIIPVDDSTESLLAAAYALVGQDSLAKETPADVEAGAEMLEKSLKLNPTSEVRFYLGRAYVEMKKNREAREQFIKALHDGGEGDQKLEKAIKKELASIG